MQILFDQEKTTLYSGRELRPHYILETSGLIGDALLAWVGPAQVETGHLVDWVDRREGETIAAQSMVHILGEFFGKSLRETVLFQRILVARIAALIGEQVMVKGNDILAATGVGKLSVSIVTASPVSTLLHLALNVDPTGAPVAAIGLESLGFEEGEIRASLVPKILRIAAAEWAEVNISCAKVRPVL